MPSRAASFTVIDPGPIPFGLLPNANDEACRLIAARALDQLIYPEQPAEDFLARVHAAGGLDAFLLPACFRVVRVALAELGAAVPLEDDFLEPATLERLEARYRAGLLVDPPVLWQNPDPEIGWDLIDGTHRLVAAERAGRTEVNIFELQAPTPESPAQAAAAADDVARVAEQVAEAAAGRS